MAQILPERTSLASELGRALGGGLQEGLGQANQQNYNQDRLSKALSNVKPGQNFVEQFKAIAPALLSTPGGAQAIGDILPLLQRQSQNDAYLGNGSPSANTPNQSSQVPGQFNQNQQTQKTQQRQFTGNNQQDFRNPVSPVSPESNFPQKSSGPQPKPELSPEQVEARAKDYVRSGMTIAEGKQQALLDNQVIKSDNDRIEAQKERQNEANKMLYNDVFQRAENSGLIKHPEDRTIAEKLAHEARNAETPTKAWEYVRSGLEKFNAARSSIETSFDAPGPITSVYRKLNGTYKDKETIIKDLQPDLEEFRKYGLYDQARNLLTDTVGLAAEDVETALFPMTESQKKDLNKFGKNPNIFAKRESIIPGYKGNEFQDNFPGEKFNLPSEKFNSFKQEIGNYLKNNPDANLLTMRGYLNQDKKYSWQDISNAVNQLIAEGQFTPDNQQSKQRILLKEAPLPGFASIFNFLLTGTK